MNFYIKSYKKDVTKAMNDKMSLCGSIQIHDNFDVNGNVETKTKKLN